MVDKKTLKNKKFKGKSTLTNEEAILEKVISDSKKIEDDNKNYRLNNSNSLKKKTFDQRLEEYHSSKKSSEKVTTGVLDKDIINGDIKKGDIRNEELTKEGSSKENSLKKENIKQDPLSKTQENSPSDNKAKKIDDEKVKSELTKPVDKRQLRKDKNKELKERKTVAGRRRWFAEHLEKAGYEFEPIIVEMIIQRVSFVFALLFGAYLLVTSIFGDDTILIAVAKFFAGGLLGFFLSMITANLGFRIFIDIKKFKRRLMVEDVLPDFFQLASANIRAGMPIDRALWFAVRPRFGVLAKEIEIVAKKTLSGGNLSESLIEFANKYDSVLVLRSFNLLNEGIQAGGNIGDLLNKIANNVQEIKSLKKEMAANVTTYVIFIGFAAVVAGPLLFGLSGQLLEVVQGISGNIGSTSSETTNTAMSSGVGISMEIGAGDSLALEDYKIFVYICLTLSSVFSAMIVSVIKKGNVKEGLQYIPIFIIVSFILYFISDYVMSLMLGGIVM